jgi:inorganic triphosphatase YgiF
MALETELKLALAPGDLPGLLAHPLLAAQAPRVQRLANTYCDTPQLTLLGQRMAVRERRIGRQTLLTVKTAGSAAGGLARRGEWEGPTEPGRFDFAALVDDADLARQLSALAGQLVPLFSTDFRRRSWLLAQGDAVIEVALDQGWITSTRDGVTRRERLLELELELQRGPVAALFDLARTLGRAAPLHPSALSKAERGYALFLGRCAPPAKAQALTLDADLPVREAFRAIALASLAQLQANEAGIAQRQADPEYIHQARVALRRLRSALRLFAPALPAGFATHWGRAWQAQAQALGDARNWDVLASEWLPQLQAAFPGHPDLAALARHVGTQRRTAQAAARASLRAHGYSALLLEFTQAVLALQAAPDQPPPDAFARDRLARRQRKIRRALRDVASLDTVARHALRIDVKKLRYALDFFASLLPAKRLRRYLALLAGVQDQLGEMNDLVTAAQLLATRPRRHADIASAWIAGRLATHEAVLPAMLAPLAGARVPWRASGRR